MPCAAARRDSVACFRRQFQYALLASCWKVGTNKTEIAFDSVDPSDKEDIVDRAPILRRERLDRETIESDEVMETSYLCLEINTLHYYYTSSYMAT